MKRRLSFWILVALVVSSSVLTFSIYKTRSNEKITSTSVAGVQTDSEIVEKVLDGGSFVLSDGKEVKLLGISTPQEGQPFYEQAKGKLKEFIVGKSVDLEYDTDKKDSSGNILAYVRQGETFINYELLKEGFAVVDTLQSDNKYMDIFTKAQMDSRNNCSGMWEGLCKQDTSACVQISSVHRPTASLAKTAGLNDEWVEILNTCSKEQNIKGYLIKNGAGDSYTFKNETVAGKQRVKLYSGCGVDSKTQIFWECPERKAKVWSKLNDSAYLYSDSDRLISQMGY